MTDEELERTRAETEAALQQFEEIKAQVARITRERESLARQYGAASFQQLVDASKRALTDEARRKNEQEQAAFLEQLQREARDDAERARSAQQPGPKPVAPRRIRKMV